MSIKWTKAPTKTYWGDMMVQADIEIDADHTLSLYCEEDQVDKVNAMLDGIDKIRAALAERDAEIERLKGPVPEDTISNQRTIQDNPRSAIGIMQRQNKKIEAQRKVLETAEEALKQAHAVLRNSIHLEAAITAIQEQLA